MIRHWSNDYLGLTFRDGGAGIAREDGRKRPDDDGMSCWGMVRHAYREHRSIVLPSYIGVPGLEEAAEIAAGLAGDATAWPWHEIAEDEVREFDLVTFRYAGVEAHVGLVRAHGQFLHIADGITSRVEHYDAPHWRPLIGRFLRYEHKEIPSTPRHTMGGRDHLVVLPSFDPVRDRIELLIEPGMTIAEAIALALPKLAPAQHARLRVTIGLELVPPELWPSVRPKAWDVVLLRVIPGADDLLRSSLLAAVAIGALLLGQYYLGPLLFGAEGAVATLSGDALTAAKAGTGLALSLGATSLFNALVPVRPPEAAAAAASVFSIDGMQNGATPGGPVPQLFGEMRFAPPFACQPYSEFVGDDRFIVAAFLLGTGPVDLSAAAPRVGMTDLTEFNTDGIEYREGYDSDTPLTIITRQVIEEAFSINLKGSIPVPFTTFPQVRAAARDATSAVVVLFWLGGLIAYDVSGGANPWEVQTRIEYRLVGDVAWTFETTLTIDGATLTPFWRTHEVTFPTRGDYELRVTRYSQEYDDAVAPGFRVVSRVMWVALQSIRPEYPINYKKPVALAALKIKASGQLNGTLETFNLFGRRLCPDYDAGTNTWPTRATSNPASIAQLILRGPQNTFPELDANIDQPDFANWHVFNDSKGLTYNAYITEPVTRDNALADVCHAGRALPYRVGSTWSMIIDKPRTLFDDHIGSSNSWGLKESDPVLAFPDAYAVTFRDKTSNYAERRRVVPFPGVDEGDVVVVEDLAMPGKVDPAEVWIETRRRQYEAIHRTRSWTVNKDAEQLAIRRGGAAYLAHPVIDRRQSAGRVRSLSGYLVELSESVTMEAGGSYRCRFRGAGGDSLDRAVVTMAGATRAIVITPGTMPLVGDFAMFYSLAAPIIEVIVKGKEYGDHHSGLLTLIPHAPEIDALTDAEVPPAWNGRGGEIL